jgi:ATP-dependent exoDNAse (exonuclease V) beta subunit
MLVDSQQRQEALDIEQSFLIKAPAGSGKTGLLTNRTLVALSVADSLEEVVGMTFTNKAAQEMKDRIGLSIKRAQDGYVPKNDFEAENLKLAKAALANSDKHGWGLGDSCEHLNVSTIDSFCRTLLKGRYESSEHLSVSMDVMADASPLYEYAARMVLSKCEDQTYGQTIREILTHFGNRASKVEELIIDALKKRDRWLDFLFKGRHVAKDILEENRAEFVESVFYKESSDIRGFEHRLQEVFSKMETPIELESFLEKGFNKDLVSSFDTIKYLSNVLLTQKLEAKSRFTVKDGVPQEKDKKKEIVTLLKELSSEMAPILRELSYLPTSEFKDTEWKLLNALFDVMPLALASLKMAFNKYSKVDFTEVALAAVFALKNDSELGATDAAIRKTQTIRHLLVDEFQDSSDLQMDMIKMIVDAWSGEQVCSVFLVGDAMQSLYGFRGANVNQFMTAEKGLGNLTLKVLSLHTNFRSSTGVIDWVNRVFEGAFPKNDDLVVSACSYNASTAVKFDGNTSPVQIHGFINDCSDNSSEAEFILNQIKDIKSKDPTGTIAVLGKTRGALKSVISAFEIDLGIDKVDVNISLLKTDPIAKVIVSLAKSLSNPTDDVALYALMSGPLVGLSTAQISYLNKGTKSLCESIKFYGHEGFDGFESEIQDVLEVLRSVFNDVDRCFHSSFHDVMLSAWDRLSGGSILTSKDDQFIADTLFSLFDDAESSLITDKYINDKISALYKPVKLMQEGSNPVQFMTIHQSKGLEFDHVFIPSASRSGNVNSGQLLQWSEMKINGESLSVLATSQEMGLSKDSGQYIKFLNRLQSRKEREETVRVGYVGVTRAISQVYITASLALDQKTGLAKAPPKNSLLGMFFNAVEEEVVIHECSTVKEKVDEVFDPTVTKIIRYGEVAIDGRNILSQYESADIYRPVTQNRIVWVDDTSKHEGIVIHKFIEQIGLEGINKWDILRLKMYKGVIHSMLKEVIGNGQQLMRSVERVCNEVNNAVQCTVFRELAGDHRCDELELRVALQHNGKLNYLIIDKGFIDNDGTGMVVDWKSAIDKREDNVSFIQFQQGIYKRKMAMYKKAYAEIHGIESVEASLYFTSLNQAVGI